MRTNSFFNFRLKKDKLLSEILQTDFSIFKDLRILVVGNYEDSQLLFKIIFEDYQVQVKTVK